MAEHGHAGGMLLPLVVGTVGGGAQATKGSREADVTASEIRQILSRNKGATLP